MKPTFRMLLVLVAWLIAPQHLAAQFEAVTALFKEVHSITVYGQGAYLPKSNLRGDNNCIVNQFLCGVGTEVLIDVGKSEGRHVELGLGASYLSGFEAKTSSLELNGAIRSFPTFSAYLNNLRIPRVGGEYYFGGGIGIAELLNAQAYDSLGAERDVKGSTFELGVVGGRYWTSRRGIGVFLEASWRWRRFSSLDYTLIDTDSGRVPQSWPRELRVSGPSIAMGLQFRLKEDPAKPTVQVWTLARVNAQALPAVVEAIPSPGSVQHTQIVFGSLTMRSTDSTYTLQIVSRDVVVNAEGAVQSFVAPPPPTPTEEHGTYLITDGELTLDPVRPKDRASTVYTITELADELVIRDSQNGYVLTFRKPGSQTPSEGSDSKKEDDAL